MHLREKTTASETIWDGKIFRITKDTALLEDGTEAERDVLHHSGGVCVLPLTDSDTILMVQQFRYPMQEITLEIPAGKREIGEDSAACGLRELREETGRTCQNYISLGKMYPTPAYDTEVIEMYLATGLSVPESQNLDAGEFLGLTEIPFREAVDMVMRGEIPDAKTQTAILKTYLLRETGKLENKSRSF